MEDAKGTAFDSDVPAGEKHVFVSSTHRIRFPETRRFDTTQIGGLVDFTRNSVPLFIIRIPVRISMWIRRRYGEKVALFESNWKVERK